MLQGHANAIPLCLSSHLPPNPRRSPKCQHLSGSQTPSYDPDGASWWLSRPSQPSTGMTSAVPHFTPLEKLLLCQQVSAHGAAIDESFSGIAASLRASPILRQEPEYDEGRLDEDQLQRLYLRLLGDAKRSAYKQKEQGVNGETTEQEERRSPRKRKLKSTSPSPEPLNVQDARKHSHLLPGIVDRLYEEYKDRVVEEIKEDERRYDEMSAELKELGTGDDTVDGLTDETALRKDAAGDANAVDGEGEDQEETSIHPPDRMDVDFRQLDGRSEQGSGKTDESVDAKAKKRRQPGLTICSIIRHLQNSIQGLAQDLRQSSRHLKAFLRHQTKQHPSPITRKLRPCRRFLTTSPNLCYHQVVPLQTPVRPHQLDTRPTKPRRSTPQPSFSTFQVNEPRSLPSKPTVPPQAYLQPPYATQPTQYQLGVVPSLQVPTIQAGSPLQLPTGTVFDAKNGRPAPPPLATQMTPDNAARRSSAFSQHQVNFSPGSNTGWKTTSPEQERPGNFSPISEDDSADESSFSRPAKGRPTRRLKTDPPRHKTKGPSRFTQRPHNPRHAHPPRPRPQPLPPLTARRRKTRTQHAAARPLRRRLDDGPAHTHDRPPQ